MSKESSSSASKEQDPPAPSISASKEQDPRSSSASKEQDPPQAQRQPRAVIIPYFKHQAGHFDEHAVPCCGCCCTCVASATADQKCWPCCAKAGFLQHIYTARSATASGEGVKIGKLYLGDAAGAKSVAGLEELDIGLVVSAKASIGSHEFPQYAELVRGPEGCCAGTRVRSYASNNEDGAQADAEAETAQPSSLTQLFREWTAQSIRERAALEETDGSPPNSDSDGSVDSEANAAKDCCQTTTTHCQTTVAGTCGVVCCCLTGHCPNPCCRQRQRRPSGPSASAEREPLLVLPPAALRCLSICLSSVCSGWCCTNPSRLLQEALCCTFETVCNNSKPLPLPGPECPCRGCCLNHANCIYFEGVEPPSLYRVNDPRDGEVFLGHTGSG